MIINTQETVLVDRIQDFFAISSLKIGSLVDNNQTVIFHQNISGGIPSNFSSQVIDLIDNIQDEGLLGDINGDNSVNVLDVVVLVDYILNPGDSELEGGDINEDETINVLDVVNLVNIILFP